MIQFLKKVKSRLNRYLLRFPGRVQCNVCNWRGRRMLNDSWHPNTICPKCDSQVRHRLVLAAMNGSKELSIASLAGNKKLLHFAPEPQLANSLKNVASEYITTDFNRNDVDLKLDMCDMRVFKDNHFDLIVACDVLEHVSNDFAAMQELFRILKPEGWAILTVPQKAGLAETFEDKSITSESGRLAAFGQEDHLRIYGDNFPDILHSHHFSVTTIDGHHFEDEIIKKNVLLPPVLSSHPLATNNRKVFFAQKLP